MSRNTVRDVKGASSAEQIGLVAVQRAARWVTVAGRSHCDQKGARKRSSERDDSRERCWPCPPLAMPSSHLGAMRARLTIT
jgi:hypothetical protein